MTTESAVRDGVDASGEMRAGVSGAYRLGAEAEGAPMQLEWSERSLTDRLRVLRRARHMLAEHAEELAQAISPALARTHTDTLVSEVLPLLDACRFLEREAKPVLRTKRLGRRGRPLWLTGVMVEIQREPLGHVLVIGPANFPLFLPGVQVLQALAAGNAVTWKPGDGGSAVAQIVARALWASGVPREALEVTDDSVEAAQRAIAAMPDKVIFTGSAESGRQMLAGLAATATPAVMELSGADAIVVMPGADMRRVARVVAFGLRLNGGSVCMSPRRLFAAPSDMALLRPLLEAELAKVPATRLHAKTAGRLEEMLKVAVQAGAQVHGVFCADAQRPVVVDRATVDMQIACSDLFAPVISLLEAESISDVPIMYARCPYALTAAIFCNRRDEARARELAKRLKAGTVLINDAIAPTADPRVPFGGRGDSGYGVTRGAEGLLEMTAVKTLIVRRGGSMRHLDPTKESDTEMFTALIASVHGSGVRKRWAALKKVMQQARG